MLQGKRQNFHHSKLPKVGEIGTVKGLNTINPTRKLIVTHYPLCDNILPYSIGIHTFYGRFLDNGEQVRLSGHLFNDGY
jgi:hypothetical protein